MDDSTYGWIRLRGLHISGVRVGIYPHERDDPRSIVVDVALWAQIGTAARSERLADTVDYATAANRVREVCGARYYPLVETLCEEIARVMLAEFRAARVRVEVVKPNALAPGDVSVEVERAAAP
ncbi:MAG: dihydroneopterin aldolase [Deltaproteobacteria bacterium]|nr:dihydroneopterin aldolase [Deltaproteobacteria bacterium]